MKKYWNNKFFWALSFFLFLPVSTQAQGWRLFMPEAEPFGLSERSVTEIITTIMMWLLGLIGILSVIAFAVSGIMYLTSAGDTNRADQAKKYVGYSVIGVIVSMIGLVVFLTVRSILSGTGTF